MGLQKSSGRRTFLSISAGNLVRQHENPIEGVTISRTNKNGKEVHEEMFKSLEATITAIKPKEAPFGKVWELEMQDGDESFVISWPYSSRYTNNFFRLLPNINLSEPIKFSPWSMKDKKDSSKTVIGISIYQSGHEGGKVPFKWSKEQPGDLPDLVQKKVKGQKVWDDTDQLEFFEKLANEINENLKFNPSKKKVPITIHDAVDVEGDDEPLPF